VIDRASIDGLTDIGRDPSYFGTVAPNADETLGMEGLPGSMTRLVVDGVPVGRPAGGTGGLLGGPVRGHVPRIGLREVALATVGGDAELPNMVGGALLETTGRAGRSGLAYGTFLPGSIIEGPGDPPEVGNGVSVGGFGSRRAGERSLLSAGIEFLRIDLPKVGSFGLEPNDPSAPAAFATLAEDRVRQLERLRGFARLDYASDDLAVRVTAGLNQASSGNDGTGLLRGPYGSAASTDGLGVFANGSLRSPLGANSTFEFKLGFDRDERTADAGLDEADFGFPATILTGSGGRLGLGQRSGGSSKSQAVFLSPQVSGITTSGRWKLGGQLESRTFDFANDERDRPLFVFSDTDGLGTGTGGLLQGAPVEANEFRVTTVGGFAQAVFPIGSRGTFSLGGRLDWTQLPLGGLETDSLLIGLTGVAPPSNSSTVGGGGSARVSWNLDEEGTRHVFALVGSSQGMVDPEALNEVLSLSAGQQVRRYTGAVGPWPGGPTTGGTSAPQFTLLGAEYRGPRTFRSQVGVAGQAGPLTLGAWVTGRRTDFLLRRRDLNLRLFASSSSPQQEAVFGSLERYGTSVFATPGSDRRFGEFDRVWALDPDGWSEYLGATLSLEYEASSHWVSAAYTLSRTEDNWVGAGSPGLEAQLRSRSADQWDEALSDFDLPHRLFANGGLRLPIPGELSFSGSYRLRSGYPFTPAYRQGVDLNADGSGFNDVPLLDPQLGAGALGWSCLDTASARVATRNDCRGSAVHEVDLTVLAGIPNVAGAKLRVDLVNAFSSEWGRLDNAVYLVDASGPSVDSLLLNPDFGRITVPLTAPRMLRVGFSWEF
ncbi:MAG: hypothetical protein ACR2QM_18775, partial [Longimicrobiales bacterium]